MSEEATDKSIVVWYPRLICTIPDAKEFTSLCLFHDQVVLCSFLCGSGEDRDIQERILPYYQTKPAYGERITFIRTIEFLARQNIINLITARKFTQVGNDFARAGKTSLSPKLVERFCNFVDVRLRRIKEEDIESQAVKIEEALELSEAIVSCQASIAYDYPLVTDETYLQDPNNSTASTEILSEMLSQSAICQLALPDVKAIHIEDLLDARTELKDELLEFRAGILKLTWLLHQQVQNRNDLKQIRHEAATLANTVIKGSLLSLENRMRQHKKKRIRRMLFGTGRVLVEATKLFLPSGAAEKMISGGKSILQLANEIDSAKLPEDQVVTYLYRLKGKFKTNN
ncbi:MAG: hypothetical protein CEE38_17465 [Planctomycetes bacterium B3_Pla]|nr:MAG: hypothetical protein CEE38_17465 [Planctomycetes bacterium B3_Pla]